LAIAIEVIDDNTEIINIQLILLLQSTVLNPRQIQEDSVHKSSLAPQENSGMAKSARHVRKASILLLEQRSASSVQRERKVPTTTQPHRALTAHLGSTAIKTVLKPAPSALQGPSLALEPPNALTAGQEPMRRWQGQARV
jgi:hypothetical protein